MAYTERLARAEIAAWPDSRYEFTDYIDDDGMDPDPIPINVTVTVAGDSLDVDFEGTAPQVRGAINATGSFARSAVYACVRGLMDTGIPNNGGYFRPISVQVPEGSVINPKLPAAVAARGLTGFRMANAIFGALAQAAPHRVPACEAGGDTGIRIAGYDGDGRAFVFLEVLHASWGADRTVTASTAAPARWRTSRTTRSRRWRATTRCASTSTPSCRIAEVRAGSGADWAWSGSTSLTSTPAADPTSSQGGAPRVITA